MAVKSLSIPDDFLKKITTEAKQKGLTFSELACQRMALSYEPTSSKKSDNITEIILQKNNSIDADLKKIISILQKQNPQMNIENKLNQRLDNFERKIEYHVTDLDKTIANQNQLLRDLYPRIRYMNSYDWSDTFWHSVDHFFSFSWIHLTNILLSFFAAVIISIVLLNHRYWSPVNVGWLFAGTIIPTYYLLLHRIMRHLVIKVGWHQKEPETLSNNRKKIRR
jgi:hypothetical protein